MNKTEKRRFEDLLACGFLGFEAKVLCVMPFDVPYFRDGITKRSAELEDFLSKGGKREDFEAMIRDTYLVKGWTVPISRTGHIELSPWAMIRESEDRYKSKHIDDYTSPWIKKPLKQTRFKQKYEKSREKLETRIKVIDLRKETQ